MEKLCLKLRLLQSASCGGEIAQWASLELVCSIGLPLFPPSTLESNKTWTEIVTDQLEAGHLIDTLAFGLKTGEQPKRNTCVGGTTSSWKTVSYHQIGLNFLGAHSLNLLHFSFLSVPTENNSASNQELSNHRVHKFTSKKINEHNSKHLLGNTHSTLQIPFIYSGHLPVICSNVILNFIFEVTEKH